MNSFEWHIYHIQHLIGIRPCTSTKPPWNVSSWCEVTSPPTRGCLKMYIDCGSTSGSRVMKPTAIFCAKKTVFSELVLEGEWSDHPKWESTHRHHFFFFQEVFWTPSQLFLKHPNYSVLGRNFLYFMVHLCSRPSGRSQVAGSFQPNSSTSSAICQGWESQRHFSQHIQNDEEFNFNFLQMPFWADFASHQLQPCWTGCTLERPGP